MSFKEKIKIIVEGNDTVAGRTFDICIQLLILYSLICLTFETLPNLSKETLSFLVINEFGLIIIFTLEYFLRLWVADEKLKHIRSPFAIIDLVAILPFYIGLGSDMRSVRALRFIRLIHILKLARFSASLNRYRLAFLEIRVDLAIFTGLTLILFYLSAVGIYHFEHDAQPEVYRSIFDAMWWSVGTFTTVGYGDIYPITVGGKIFTFFVLLLGLGTVAVPTGLVATALTNARQQETAEARVLAELQQGKSPDSL